MLRRADGRRRHPTFEARGIGKFQQISHAPVLTPDEGIITYTPSTGVFVSAREDMHLGGPAAEAPLWPQTASKSVGMTEAGLVLGAGSILVRMGTGADGAQHLALDIDEDRLLALLSVAEGGPVLRRQALPPIEAAAAHWQGRDKALANLRLAFADLPRLRHPTDADRVALAEHLLDAGMAPNALMKELWPGSASDRLDKHNYNRDQPRVPAGSGDEGGQWTSGVTGSSSQARRDREIVVAGQHGPPDEDEKEYEERRQTRETTPEEDVAHSRPIDPMGGLPAGVGPGPYAGRSVPAGPSTRPSPIQRLQVDEIGREAGCHTCGSKDPRTKSGMFIPDHQCLVP